MSIQNVGRVINMEKETIVEVTKLGFTIQAAVKVIGKDLLITLTGGDTPHIGTVTTFSRDTEMQTVRFPSHDGRFHKDDVLAEKIAVIIKTAVPEVVPSLPVSMLTISPMHKSTPLFRCQKS